MISKSTPSISSIELELRHANLRIGLQNSLTRVFSESKQVDEGINAALEVLCRHYNCDAGIYWKLHPKIIVLRYGGSWLSPDTQSADFVRSLRKRMIRRNQEVAGLAWATGRPASLSQLQEIPALEPSSGGCAPAIAFPIQAPTEFYGVVEFYSKTAILLDDEFSRHCTSIGMSIGLFIQRMKTREALRESEARKTAILETALDAIISIDHENRVLEFNPAAERIFGYSRAEILGQDFSGSIIPVRFRESYHRAFVDYVFKGQGPALNQRTEIVLTKADGSEFPAEIAITRVRRESRPAPIFTCYIRDITTQKAAEAQIKSSNNLLLAIIETSPDAIFVKDLQSRYLMINSAGAAMVGKTVSEVKGATNKDLFQPENVGEMLETDRQALETRKSITFEHTSTASGITRTYLTSKAAYYNEHGEAIGILGIARDITERKKAEETAHFLAEASQVLSSSLDFQTTLTTMAWLAIPTLADLCSVGVLQEDGSVKVIALAHNESSQMPLWQSFVECVLNQNYGGPGHVSQNGQPELIADFESFLSNISTADPDLERLSKELGLKSFINIPLSARGRTIGVLTFATAESKRIYQAEDLALAEELGRRAAAAFDNAQIYQALQSAQSDAEKVRNRLQIQCHVMRVLTQAQTSKEALPLLFKALAANEAWELGVYWMTENSETNQVKAIDTKTGFRTRNISSGMLRVDQIWNLLENGQDQTAAIRQRSFRCGEGLPGKTWESHSAIYVAAAPKGDIQLSSAFSGLDGVRSALFLPIAGDKKFFGVLALASFYSRSVDTELIRVLEDLGYQIGRFMEKEDLKPDRSVETLAPKHIPQIKINPVSFEVSYNGQQSVALTSKEFQIVTLMQNAPESRISRSELVNRIWGKSKISTNSLDVHLFNLRRKIAPIGIEITFQPPNLYQFRF